MAKLTLSFKGYLLSTHPVEGQPLLIGRDPNCQIRIDSLAIAPKHALISSKDDSFSVKALDAEYPVRINMEPLGKPRKLEHGDMLLIGKHTLIFSSAAGDSTPPETASTAAAGSSIDQTGKDTKQCLCAYLQVQSGVELGRILTFRRAVTRLTKVGADHVIVTRHGDSLSLSLLTNESEASIDGLRIAHGIEFPLRNGSMIEVNGVRCRLFCD